MKRVCRRLKFLTVGIQSEKGARLLLKTSEFRLELLFLQASCLVRSYDAYGEDTIGFIYC